MTVWKNKNFNKRDYETSNIVYAEGVSKPPFGEWEEIKGVVPAGLSQLWIVNGTRIFGYM